MKIFFFKCDRIWLYKINRLVYLVLTMRRAPRRVKTQKARKDKTMNGKTTTCRLPATWKLSHCTSKRGYCAKVVGSDPKWIFKREFLDKSKVDTSNKRWVEVTIEEPGIYEFVTYSAKGNKTQWFYGIVADLESETGFTKTELDIEELKARLGAPKSGQKPERSAASQGRCPECDEWLPSHEITCAFA